MPLAVFLPTNYQSAYGLLGHMATELAEALAEAGAEINPTRLIGASEPRVYVFFNFPADLQAFRAWCRPDEPGTVLLHIFVDHPLALATDVVDELVRYPGYRLLLPCIDDLHLLHLRWPGIRCITLPHAVSPKAIVNDAPAWEDRPFDVVCAGSIAAPEEIVQTRMRVPEAIRSHADDAAEYMGANPSASLLQAIDLCMPSGLAASDYWGLLRVLFAYVIPKVNRDRRMGIVRTMKGRKTLVLGAKAWSEVCGGNIVYGGDVSYRDLTKMLSEAKVCIAWNPTQFTMTSSERVLLSMAAGCATVTEPRAAFMRAFGTALPSSVIGNEQRLGDYERRVDALLNDAQSAADSIEKGMEALRTKHLWSHRLPIISAAIESVLRG